MRMRGITTMHDHPTHDEHPNDARSGDDALTLTALGLTPFFRQQCPLEAPALEPARVLAVARSGLDLAFEGWRAQVPLGGRWHERDPEDRPTVGDWVLVDRSGPRIESVLERASVFRRRAAGGDAVQLVAANVEVVLLVSACNRDFNPARLERYLAMTLEAGATPVVVLTRADLVEDPAAFAAEAARLRPGLPVEAVNALDPATLDGVRGWATPGTTLALLGSSGVGKTTLLNTLAGHAVQDTGAARADDDRGRHTTTHRSLHRIPGGAWVLDSPGMRELGLVDAGAGVRAAFPEIDALAPHCRFADCGHDGEPGCAVQAAIDAGTLDADRLARFRKLEREDRHATETVAEARARSRRRGRVHRAASKARERRRS
jgi:ribosome biogenesis GTPase